MFGAQSTLRRRLTLRRSASLPKESMKHHLQDYCTSTSIHALKYVAEPRRPTIEKAWWLIILLTCFVCNIMLIRKMWLKFYESPPEDYAIYEIPFPAITICNEVRLKKSVYDALNATEEGRKKLDYLKLIERYSDMSSKEYTMNLSRIFGMYSPRKKGNTTVHHPQAGGFGQFVHNSTIDSEHADDAIKFLMEATPSLEEMMTSCLNVFTLLAQQDCLDWFQPVLTDLGICYSINVVDTTHESSFAKDYDSDEFGDYYEYYDWLPELGEYRDPKNHMAYPYKALSNGRLFGFSFELKTNLSEIWEHRNNEENSGFKVLLHRPEDHPVMGEPPVYVPTDTEVIVLVTPVINTISEGLKAYKPKDRKCYTKGEKRLSLYRVYTQKNCELECLTNFTYNMCNCVAIHMPRNKSMRACSPAYRECVLQAEIKIMWEWKLPDCECWPSCFSLEYKTSLQYGTYYSNSSRSLKEEGFAASKLVVFFESNKVPNHQRREIVDLVDFLSSCGGLLGLFSGMSILSFCEIFYYLTLRLWNNIRLVREKVIFKAPEAAAPRYSPAKETGDTGSVHTIS